MSIDKLPEIDVLSSEHRSSYHGKRRLVRLDGCQHVILFGFLYSPRVQDIIWDSKCHMYRVVSKVETHTQANSTN